MELPKKVLSDLEKGNQRVLSAPEVPSADSIQRVAPVKATVPVQAPTLVTRPESSNAVSVQVNAVEEVLNQKQADAVVSDGIQKGKTVVQTVIVEPVAPGGMGSPFISPNG